MFSPPESGRHVQKLQLRDLFDSLLVDVRRFRLSPTRHLVSNK